MKGQLTLIDGSPEMLGTIVKTHMIGKTESDFQNYVLGYLVTLMYQNVDSRKKLEYLLTSETWDEKCEKTVDLLLELGYKYGRDDMQCLLNAYYGRAFLLQSEIEETYSLIEKSSCMFIKPSETTLEHQSETYELKKYFKNNVEILNVQGNHQSMLENPEMIQILNDINGKI